MGPKDVPEREGGGGDDPLLREVSIPPAEPEVVPVELPATPRKAPPEGSPLNDYLLELEQEFQDQEDEGKL
ncbi:MAG TPA: hypothetical protein VFE78_21230 [Gemmataceae bacterium]|jgi:hypothetical protein|nr:hypothetical protein [Gemmataceae bacterium]